MRPDISNVETTSRQPAISHVNREMLRTVVLRFGSVFELEKQKWTCTLSIAERFGYAEKQRTCFRLPPAAPRRRYQTTPLMWLRKPVSL